MAEKSFILGIRAGCDTCCWFIDDEKNTYRKAQQHANKTGHKTWVETINRKPTEANR